jgi:hypothetical protein
MISVAVRQELWQSCTTWISLLGGRVNCGVSCAECASHAFRVVSRGNWGLKGRGLTINDCSGLNLVGIPSNTSSIHLAVIHAKVSFLRDALPIANSISAIRPCLFINHHHPSRATCICRRFQLPSQEPYILISYCCLQNERKLRSKNLTASVGCAVSHLPFALLS